MLAPPRTLSPSKVATFCDCALAFRFSAIDRLPDPPSPQAVRGTLVHAALERLFVEPPERRTVDRALTYLAEAAAHPDDEYRQLELDPQAEADLVAGAEELVRRYFTLEDPTQVRAIGLEVRLEAEIGGVRLRGIIDRLELDPEGNLVVTDYKTGRAPKENYERGRLDGVQLYALLCERLFGTRPAKVQLLYLADPLAIVSIPTDQSVRATERKLGAIWTTVERACRSDDFRPRQSRLCDYCAFQAYCPVFGGNPDDARHVRSASGAAGELDGQGTLVELAAASR